ncbi:hypothetical protein PVAP13_5KG091500 [Panicum virgatum]|uniref:Uncharacterized protein n=1 Tax=Panicum virgatum TaxID=38727 RepID=A0A8T0SAU0_PANVG|nr:hypothetical protein PVAP13_5KG091500 [Panicum virgatum]
MAKDIGGGTPCREEDVHMTGGLVGFFAIAAASTVVAALSGREPPRGIDDKTCFLALWGIFLAGAVLITAAVWASDAAPRRRAAARNNLTCCASAVAIIVLSAAAALHCCGDW